MPSWFHRVYEATALIQIEEGKAGNWAGGGALNETSALFENRSPANAEISILRSNLILDHVIDRLGLDLAAHPKHVPVIGYWLSSRATEPSKPGFLGLPGYVTGNESIQVGRFVVPRELEGKTFTVTLTGTGYTLREPGGNVVLHGRIGKPEVFSVGGKPGEMLVNSAVGHVGAEFMAKRFARTTLLNDLQRSLSIEEQGKQSGVLRVKLTGRDADRVARTLNEISDYYIQQNIERRVAEVDKALNFVSGHLPNLRERLQQTEQQLSRLRSRRGTFDLSTEGRLTLEQSRGLQSTLLELQRKREDLQATYLPQHPVMRALEAQIESVNSDLAKVGGRIRTMPALEQELLGLNRELKVNSDLYVNLLNSAQQLGLAKQSRGGKCARDRSRQGARRAGRPACRCDRSLWWHCRSCARSVPCPAARRTATRHQGSRGNRGPDGRIGADDGSHEPEATIPVEEGSQSGERFVRAGNEISVGSGCRGFEEHAHPVAGRQAGLRCQHGGHHRSDALGWQVVHQPEFGSRGGGYRCARASGGR